MTRLLLSLVAGILLLAPVSAFADTMAGLQIEIGPSIDALVRTELESAIDETLQSVSSWKWIGEQAARNRMNPVVRDCFTDDCLKKAGTTVGAEAGLRVQISGESQIYDWTVEIYDLRDGQLLTSKKGACELCGRTEVVREFKESLRTAVVATTLPQRPTKTPPVVTKPVDEKPAETTEERPPVQTPSADPTEGLVVLDISVEPADATISIGDQVLGTGNAAISLEPGTHAFRFKREGYQGIEETFVVGPQTSQRAFMRVHLSRTDPEAVTQVVDGPIDRLGKQRTTYGLVALGTGAGFLVAGAWLNHLDGRSACDSGTLQECPEVYATGGAAFATTLIGATFVTAGGALLAWELLAGSSDTGELSARLMPTVVPGGVGVGLGGRF